MKHALIVGCGLVVAACATSAQERTNIAPQAERVLRAACQYLAEAPFFGFTADISREHVTEAGNATYYYAGGAFYLQQPTGFQVMPAPLGVVVTTLPSGSTRVAMKGVLYYQAANGYYLPTMMGGVTVYTTSQP